MKHDRQIRTARLRHATIAAWLSGLLLHSWTPLLCEHEGGVRGLHSRCLLCGRSY